jgi:hypothetical protein
MADAAWRNLAAPMRGAVRALRAAGNLVRRAGDDTTLGQRMCALSELPGCVAFHPFAGTAGWSVDLEREQQADTAQTASTQPWTPELTRNARRRQQISLVKTAASGTHSAPLTNARAAQSEAAMPAPASVAPHSDAQLAAQGPPPANAGAWSALRGIAQLVDALEPASGVRGPRSPAVPATASPLQRTLADAASSVPPQRVAAAPAGTTANTPAQPAATTNTSIVTDSATASAPDPMRRTPLALLAQYVTALWSGHEARPLAGSEQGVRGTTPAPRAPSLLLPGREHQPRDASGGNAHSSAANDSVGELAAPASSASTEEELADRLNRSLLEQAWLRGVDLT